MWTMAIARSVAGGASRGVTKATPFSSQSAITSAQADDARHAHATSGAASVLIQTRLMKLPIGLRLSMSRMRVLLAVATPAMAGARMGRCANGSARPRLGLRRQSCGLTRCHVDIHTEKLCRAALSGGTRPRRFSRRPRVWKGPAQVGIEQLGEFPRIARQRAPLVPKHRELDMQRLLPMRHAHDVERLAIDVQDRGHDRHAMARAREREQDLGGTAGEKYVRADIRQAAGGVEDIACGEAGAWQQQGVCDQL